MLVGEDDTRTGATLERARRRTLEQARIVGRHWARNTLLAAELRELSEYAAAYDEAVRAYIATQDD